MKVGKLTPAQLEEHVLRHIKLGRSSTLIGSRVGEDCAVIDNRELTFLTTDPITAVISGDNDIGGLAVNVACNDIASCGATPIAVLLTIMLPPMGDPSDVADIIKSAQHAAGLLNVDIVGGHTEFTDAVNRAVVVATAVGSGAKPILSSTAKVGDAIIVTNSVGLEGTAILAYDYPQRLDLTKLELNQARALFASISVVNVAKALVNQDISTMHDITEGGLLGACIEVASCSKVGFEIDLDSVPVHPLTVKICDQLSINPYRLLSSGSMLITSSVPSQAIQSLKDKGITATVIGKITEQGYFTQLHGIRNKCTLGYDEINNVD